MGTATLLPAWLASYGVTLTFTYFVEIHFNIVVGLACGSLSVQSAKAEEFPACTLEWLFRISAAKTPVTGRCNGIA